MSKKKRRRPARAWRIFLRWWKRLPVRNSRLALLLLNLAVLLAGLESAWVQVATTHRAFSVDLIFTQSFWLLLCLDMLVPLIVALLSRRAFLVFLAGQCFLSTILMHYTIFFYNPLTLSSIYHSVQGAASLGFDIFGFARAEIILIVGALFALKVLLVQLSNLPDKRMPPMWTMRGITAVAGMAVVCMISILIYGKTGMSVFWVDSRGHRTATERRQEEGTTQAVRSIGYMATWIGEWLSGTYKDTALIYAETRCPDPGLFCGDADEGCLPLPPVGETVVMIQVESLDYAALDMRVNGHQVTPFLNLMARDSLVLRAFAPHKVGSCNSDYELLNARVASQNVIYYSYIKSYPDSVIHPLADKGYRPAVFHGLPGNIFNLREAYAQQGFVDFFFKEEMLAAGYGASQGIMEHVLDEGVFDMAANKLAIGGRQAQFIITMSSHIPFLPATPMFKSAGGTFARYVSSLRYLDQCLAAYYAKLPAGTLLIIWGDHGSDVSYPRGFPDNARRVPFLVHIKPGGAGSDWLQGYQRHPATPPELVGMMDDFPPETREFSLCELSFFLRRIFENAPREH